jgi:hypothetical protein
MTIRYAHLSPAHLRAPVDRLDGLTGSSVPTTTHLERPADHASA